MTESQQRIKQLAEQFKSQEAAYLSPGYQESQVRQDFIDKFFTYLGWDVTHEIQKNPYEQEVKIENKVNTSGSQRRADYAFFTAPNFRDVKFFVEAKKPSKSLANPNDYHQTIRYGWNSKTPIAVLTDFEEFHILDCRYKPDIKTALDRKIEVFHYTDYEDEEKFQRIFYLFNRDEVANGSIDKFAAALPKPRAKAARKGMFKAEYKPVDEAFLESLDGYREQLARAFKNKNQNLEGEELTEAVQRTIDRLVFIRFLEDKSIEEPAIVAIKDKPAVWEAFASLCKRLEPKYNGLVFKSHRIIDSADFNPPDSKMFAEICSELADPTSPYDFDKIPISILGSIYERFLGKVVSTTEKRAKVIEKPEVRKAGGVYYTPEYIVRYIVNETIGKLLYEKKGIGFSNKGIEGDSYDTTNVQGIGSVETGDVIGGGNLQTDSPPISQGGLPQRGTIRIEEPNAAIGGLNSGEHSRGIRAGESEGIPAFPIVLAGIADGRSREPNTIPQSTLNPNASTPNPIPYTLSTAYSLIPKVTPEQVAKMAFADIACGSGSFLIEVYNQLLDYYTKYYNEHPEKAKKGDVETREGKIVLSLKKRQEILTNNIYGVDIDFQATEVTQLSLYLKLLEDVTMNDAFQYSLLKEKILPDLRNNIVCGNSLIGTDILEGKLFDSEEERKLNPMNFEDMFPQVMQRGGFDAVVGNPPYIGFHLGEKEVKSYYRDHFETARGKYDQYMVFVEKAFSVLANLGIFGYIIPNKFIHSNYGETLKTFLNQFQLGEILDFRDFQVFAGAINYPCILIAMKKKPSQPFEYRLTTGINVPVIQYKTIQLDQSAWSSKNWSLTGKTESKVLSKLGDNCKTLGSISMTITQGLRTGHLESFFNMVNFESIKHYKLEHDLLRPVLHGKNVKRYSLHIDSQNDLILFPYKKDNKTPICIDHFPKTKVYLEQFKEELLNRKDSGKIFRNVGKQWFEYWDSKPICFTKPKIVFPDISKENNFCLDEQGIGYLNTCYAIFLKPDINLRYVLGILNSSITTFFMKSVSPSVRGGYFRYKTSYVERIPIYSVDFQDPTDRARHDNIVKLVEEMLAAKEKLSKAKLDAERNKLEMQIASLDRQIDQAVYELYGLTEEEIRIVEGKASD